MKLSINNRAFAFFMSTCFGLLCVFSKDVHAGDRRTLPPTAKIIDGTNVPATNYPAVANLSLDGFVCTGTLIASRYVLTAAHCVFDDRNRKVTDYSNFSATINNRDYSIREVTVNPSYVSRSAACVNGEADAAILELTEAVTGVAPIALQRTPPSVGQQLRLVGFGTQGSGSRGEDGTFPARGSVNIGETTIESIPNSLYVEWNFDRNAGESNTAGGDSGGPAFTSSDGTTLINSITCGGTGNAGFGTNSTNTRADSIAGWVDSVVGTTPQGVAPSFIALPTQTVGTGQVFSYNLQLAGSSPISISASELPEGLVLDGSRISGSPVRAGSFNVQLSAENSVGSTSGNLSIIVTSFDPGSALVLKKVSVSFSDDAEDLVGISGTINLGKGFSPKGKVVRVQIGELEDSFKLNSRGFIQRRGGFDLVRLLGTLSRGKFSNSRVRFYIGLGDREDLFDQLDTLFPTNPEELGGDFRVNFPVEIEINGIIYRSTISMKYRSRDDSWING